VFEAETKPVTGILTAIEAGDSKAAAELLPLVYDALRSLARARLARERPGVTLQPTALVHEAYLRLVGTCDPGWQGKGHFFGAAAQAMRRILVDRARRRALAARAREELAQEIDSADAIESPVEDLLALDEALTRLEARDPQKARVIELRYFAGLSTAETAEAMGVSTRTVEREWRFARAWLHRELGGD